MSIPDLCSIIFICTGKIIRQSCIKTKIVCEHFKEWETGKVTFKANMLKNKRT